MKNRFINISLIILTIFTMSGCEKWLDVNDNPDVISNEKIALKGHLPALLAEWALFGSGDNVNATLFWTCQRATWSYTPGWESFNINSTSASDIWSNSYNGTLRDADYLYKRASEENNPYYQGIAALIKAWNMTCLVDNFGKVPYTEALKYPSIEKPKFDEGKDVYAAAMTLFDEAITLLSSTNPIAGPGADDFIYEGDIEKWLKLAYSYKARYAMRLCYAPGYTKVTQANAVLTALTNGLSSSNDDALFHHSVGEATRGFFGWQQTTDYAQGIVANVVFVDYMKSMNDPRVPIYFTTVDFGEGTDYFGWKSGVATSDFPYHPSMANNISDETPETLMNYVECLFLKAEAYVLLNQWVNAENAFKAAVTESMMTRGVANADITTYLAQFTFPTTEEAAQRMVITEKWVASYLTTAEARFDWIRTGYPILDFNSAHLVLANATTMPRRYLYPQESVDRNPNTPTNAGLNEFAKGGVFWDAKP
ncbi:MAG: SusD/RagB family nutrient-binding outer membrane lipoprotein [Tenuifilaceae bacterium]